MSRGRVALALLFAALAALPAFAGPYALSIATLVLYFAYTGQAWNVMMGFAGQLSLGHALYVGIGENHISAKAVVQRIQRELRGGEEQIPVTVQRPPRGRSRKNAGAGVHVEGLDDVMVRLSRCCTPVPG